MKGIILAAGLGTRLLPITKYTNKHLFPIYDKPMIYYPLSTLMLGGMREILIISRPQDIPLYKEILGDGSHLGIQITYAAQEKPEGLAQAFIIGEKFIGNDNVCLILGDNIFYGHDLPIILETNKTNLSGGVIFTYYVQDPSQYGVVAFDSNMRVKEIIEKPKQPPSNYAVTGLYFYDNDVIEIAKSIKPSARGELEITDVNNVYLKNKRLRMQLLGRGYTWLDTGTYQSILDASQFVAVIEQRQGLKVSCPEEIAWRKGFITKDQLIEQANHLSKSTYGQYLLRISTVTGTQEIFDNAEVF